MKIYRSNFPLEEPLRLEHMVFTEGRHTRKSPRAEKQQTDAFSVRPHSLRRFKASSRGKVMGRENFWRAANLCSTALEKNKHTQYAYR